MAKRAAGKPSEGTPPTPSTEELAKAAGRHMVEVPAASDALFPPKSMVVPESPPFDFATEERKRKLSDKARDSEVKHERERLALEQEFFERKCLFLVSVVAFCIIAATCLIVAVFSKDPATQAWSRETLKVFIAAIAAFVLGRQTAGKRSD